MPLADLARQRHTVHAAGHHHVAEQQVERLAPLKAPPRGRAGPRRVGTCGGMHPDVKLRDVLIAQAASTDSSLIRNIFGGTINFCPIADFTLLEKAVANTRRLQLKATVGNIISVHSSDQIIFAGF
mgnify:CR=1 FL=1